MACFQLCWYVYKYIVHLYTCCYFRGENVRHRLASLLQNYKLSCLYLCNSFVNVIIYPLRIPEFKNCLLHLLRCCVVPHQIFRAEILPSAESGSVVSLVRFTSTQHLSPSSKQESAFWLLYRLLKVSKKSTFFTDFKRFNWGEIV